MIEGIYNHYVVSIYPVDLSVLSVCRSAEPAITSSVKSAWSAWEGGKGGRGGGGQDRQIPPVYFVRPPRFMVGKWATGAQPASTRSAGFLVPDAEFGRGWSGYSYLPVNTRCKR